MQLSIYLLPRYCIQVRTTGITLLSYFGRSLDDSPIAGQLYDLGGGSLCKHGERGARVWSIIMC